MNLQYLFYRVGTLVTTVALAVMVLSSQEKTTVANHKKVRQKTEQIKPNQPVSTESLIPKPAPEMLKLTKMLSGTWSTSEKFEPGEFTPQGGRGQGTDTVRPGPGGLSLISDYKSRNTMGPFTGHGVISWSPSEQVYRSYWFNNMKPGGELQTGKWEGQSLVFTSTGEDRGKKYYMKQTYTNFTPASFTFNIDISSEGGPLRRRITIQYRRSGAPGANSRQKS